MSGWETFGTSEDDAPISRAISRGSGRWPAGEVYEGIAFVGLQTHGDAPSSCYLRVCGTKRAAVEACWRHTIRNWKTIQGYIWP